jgi:hypothetical protein
VKIRYFRNRYEVRREYGMLISAPDSLKVAEDFAKRFAPASIEQVGFWEYFSEDCLIDERVYVKDIYATSAVI